MEATNPITVPKGYLFQLTEQRDLLFQALALHLGKERLSWIEKRDYRGHWGTDKPIIAIDLTGLTPAKYKVVMMELGTTSYMSIPAKQIEWDGTRWMDCRRPLIKWIQAMNKEQEDPFIKSFEASPQTPPDDTEPRDSQAGS